MVSPGNTNHGADRIIRAVEKEIGRIIGDDLPVLADIREYVTSSGGKRIRPLLTVSLGRLFSDSVNERALFSLGAIIEIIHAASLLHDDVLDDSEIRRGGASGKAVFGNKTVILGGDYLLACAMKRLNAFGSAELMDVFTEVLRQLSVAELLQMQYSRDPSIKEDIYRQIIYGKTAILFEACGKGAAILLNSTDSSIRKAARIGRMLGELFQIRDDTLDYFYPELLGKDPLTDFTNGLYTLPLIYLRQHPEHGVLVDAIMKNDRRRKTISGRLEIMRLLRLAGTEDRLATELRNIEQKIRADLSGLEARKESRAILGTLETLLAFTGQESAVP